MVTRSAAGITRLNSSTIIRSGVKVFSPVIKRVATFSLFTALDQALEMDRAMRSALSVPDVAHELAARFRRKILVCAFSAEIIERDPQRRLGLLLPERLTCGFPHRGHKSIELNLPSWNLWQPLQDRRFGQGQTANTIRMLGRKKEGGKRAIGIT